MDEQPTLPAEVRASLPPIAQAYIAFLERQVALLRDQVATLQATVSKLQGQMADTPVQSALARWAGPSSEWDTTCASCVHPPSMRQSRPADFERRRPTWAGSNPLSPGAFSA